MILILVGCDGTGKTTLAKRLKYKFDMPIIHFDKPKTEEEKLGMFENYKHFLLNTNNVIIDRCWYCEQVYGPIMRDRSYITPEQQKELEEILLYKGAQIYHCYDTATNIICRFYERGEDYLPIEKVQAVLDGYDTILRTVDKGIPVIKYKVPEVL